MVILLDIRFIFRDGPEWVRCARRALEQLLLLGDPAAVFAVVCAEGLTDDLANRAWWACEEAENARRMLQTAKVVSGTTGKVLAYYLLEYLPFETETEKMIESVRSVLQPGLLDEATIDKSMEKSSQENTLSSGVHSSQTG